MDGLNVQNNIMISLGELGTWYGGKTPSMKNRAFWTDGIIPWISSKDVKSTILVDTEDHISDFALKEAGMKLLPAGSTVLVTRSGILKHTLPVAYVPFNSTINQDIKALIVKKEVDCKYASYVIQALSNDIRKNAKKTGGTVDSLDFQKVLSYKVPVPSLPIQKEIVRILDMYSKAETDIEKNLETELNLRKKQYEYYRNHLIMSAKDIEWIPIGELGEINRGKRFVHKDDAEEGVPAIHYGELYTHYGISATETKTHIRSELKPKMRYAHTGDVIIVGAGENKTDIGVGVAWMGPEDVAVHDACFTLTNHNQNPKYISYCLRTEDYHKKLFPFVSEGKICSFLKDGLAQVTIPIPKDIEEQERIVDLLDKLECLINGLSESLFEEKKMRHQQYEYYREKLFSFKRLET